MEAVMALLNFRSKAAPAERNAAVEAFLDGYSIEVMPRTAAKIDDFRALLPQGPRVYLAPIAGTPTQDMVSTAPRPAHDGVARTPPLTPRRLNAPARRTPP